MILFMRNLLNILDLVSKISMSLINNLWILLKQVIILKTTLKEVKVQEICIIRLIAIFKHIRLKEIEPG